MTREEAVKWLKDYIQNTPFQMEQYEKSFEVAIQALSQEPCDDAISRDELLKAIDTWDKFGYTETGCFVREPKGDYVPYIHYDDVIKSIKGMPSVTQKSGKWIIDQKEGYRIWHCHCSKCNKDPQDFIGGSEDWWVIRLSDFCPNCGCRMVEPQERSDKE